MLIIFFRSIIVFLVLLVVMRLMGKRQIGEMQPFELVITLVISELATIPMAEVSIPIMYGVISIFTLLIMHHLVALLSRKSIALRKVICGRPTIVITPNGIDFKELRSLSMSVSDLLEAMRGAGYFGFDEVEYGIFETNGKFSVLSSGSSSGGGASSTSANSTVGGSQSSDDDKEQSKSQKNAGQSGQAQQSGQSEKKNQSRVQRERDREAQQEQREQQAQPPELPALPLTLIEEGKLVKNTLKVADIDEAWILKQLSRIHEDKIKNVLVATIDNNGKMYVQQRGKQPLTLYTFFRGGNNW